MIWSPKLYLVIVKGVKCFSKSPGVPTFGDIVHERAFRVKAASQEPTRVGELIEEVAGQRKEKSEMSEDSETTNNLIHSTDNDQRETSQML